MAGMELEEGKDGKKQVFSVVIVPLFRSQFLINKI